MLFSLFPIIHHPVQFLPPPCPVLVYQCMVKNENKDYAYTTHRIGRTTYKVKVVFNDAGHETLEDKILRIIQNETVTTDGTCDIMNSPQMSRQSERSA